MPLYACLEIIMSGYVALMNMHLWMSIATGCLQICQTHVTNLRLYANLLISMSQGHLQQACYQRSVAFSGDFSESGTARMYVFISMQCMHCMMIYTHCGRTRATLPLDTTNSQQLLFSHSAGLVELHQCQ